MHGVFELIKEHFKGKVFMAAAPVSSLLFVRTAFAGGMNCSQKKKNAVFMLFLYTHIRKHSVGADTCKALL